MKIIYCLNVFLSRFHDNASKRASMTRKRLLVHVLSGEIKISEQGKTTCTGKGERVCK
jgi:hypothetical protein